MSYWGAGFWTLIFGIFLQRRTYSNLIFWFLLIETVGWNHEP